MKSDVRNFLPKVEVGGYLHVEGPLNEAAKQAILAYRAQGGGLGRTAISALADNRQAIGGPMELTIEHKREFLSLACQLSPENLSCDGERSRAEVEECYRQLKEKWHQLEKFVGRPVSEFEAWDWADEVRAADEEAARQRIREAEARFGTFPGLKMVRADACYNIWEFEGGKLSGNSDRRWAAFNIHKDTEGVVALGQIQLPVIETGFKVSSEFARTLERRDSIGEYPTLGEAYQAGLDYLQTVTFAKYREQTQFTDENIRRELQRLPESMQEAANQIMESEEDDDCLSPR